MRVIKALRSFHNDVVYINADRISSFYSFEYEGEQKTKIYYENSKCEINGNRADAIAMFMAFEKGGILDLTKDESERIADEK